MPIRKLTSKPNVDDNLNEKNTSAGMVYYLLFKHSRDVFHNYYCFTEKLEFQAETRMLLDIVAKSLYSEKEVRDNSLHKHNTFA